MRDLLRVNYAKLSSGECSSKTLDTKPELTLLERLVSVKAKNYMVIIMIIMTIAPKNTTST